MLPRLFVRHPVNAPRLFLRYVIGSTAVFLLMFVPSLVLHPNAYAWRNFAEWQVLVGCFVVSVAGGFLLGTVLYVGSNLYISRQKD